METYKIPKERAKVLMWVPPNKPDERDLYLSPFAESHQGAETVSDLLLRPKRFLPVLREGNGLQLVRKEAIRWLKVKEPERAEWHFMEQRAGAPEARIICEFREGGALEGVIYALTKPGEQRVLDVANLAQGFLPMETAEGFFLVNLNHVFQITILEESHAGA